MVIPAAPPWTHPVTLVSTGPDGEIVPPAWVPVAMFVNEGQVPDGAVAVIVTVAEAVPEPAGPSVPSSHVTTLVPVATVQLPVVEEAETEVKAS
jgi:hypothetical protein